MDDASQQQLEPDGQAMDSDTALHLAEVRALGAVAPTTRDGVPMLVEGEQRWKDYSQVDFAVGWIEKHRLQGF